MLEIGTKYQIYEDGELRVKRIIKSKDFNTYVLKDLNTGETKSVDINKINKDYVKLTPDASINIMITKEPPFNNKEVEDAYICVNKSGDLINNDNIPSLILRQNIYSKFKNMFSQDFTTIYMGDCSTIINSTKEELQNMMQFESIENKFTVFSYLDDKLEDILECIPSKFKKDINSTLLGIKSDYNDMPMAKGLSETFEDLLKDNDFIANYRSIFNIVQLDFPIVLGDNSYNNDKDIILNSKQKKRLEDTLKRYISNIKVIKYDKDIDVSKIVSTLQHVVVSDSNNEIFLIAYTVDGYYTDTNNGTDQVLEAMTHSKNL